MVEKLNQQAFQHAQDLISEHRYVLDERDDWSEHRPSAGQEDRFIQDRGWGEYQLWYLAVDDDHGEETKARYTFPYGDFESVHRCGVISAESRAAQYGHHDVAGAARRLLAMLDDLR